MNQWDLAAGRYEGGRGEGPYRGNWVPGRPLRIAVARQRPAPVGTQPDDEASPSGCRDMAGNGMELTCTLVTYTVGTGEHAPAQLLPNEPLWLRGASYSDTSPLRYQQLDENADAILLHDAPPLPYVGFRAVVELDP